jgi:hypothetical protein
MGYREIDDRAGHARIRAVGVACFGLRRQNFSRVKICWPPLYNPGSNLRRAGEAYSAKPSQHFSHRGCAYVSGLSQLFSGYRRLESPQVCSVRPRRSPSVVPQSVLQSASAAARQFHLGFVLIALFAADWPLSPGEEMTAACADQFTERRVAWTLPVSSKTRFPPASKNF